MNPYAAALAWIAAHHAEVAEATSILFLALNAGITVALKIHSTADWVVIAQQNPRIAALVRLLGALGIQPVAVLQSFIDFVRGQASPGTKSSARALQVSMSKPLIAPPGLEGKTEPDVVVLCRRCGTTWTGPYPMPMRCPICDDPEHPELHTVPVANENAKPASQVDTLPPPGSKKKP